MRRKTFGIILMAAGVALVLGAGCLLMKNHQEDRNAEAFVQMVLPEIQREIVQVQQTTPTESEMEPEVQLTDYTPVEYLSPEDLVMTEKRINGYDYVGYIGIPELDLELPVMSDWDYNKLQVSPCRYSGTLRGEDLVIMAHNYSTHFGRISRLAAGSAVVFVDMDGRVWEYEVAAMDVLSGDSVEEMTAGEYDLTLFTCDKNRSYRVTVRCNRIEEK